MTVPDDAGSASNGIKVIIVGLGIAGLSAAIECRRKGFSVVVYEKQPEFRRFDGDGIGIGTNGGMVTEKWGDGAFHDTIRQLEYDSSKTKIWDHTGYCYGEFKFQGYHGNGYTVQRGALASAMYDYAQTLGLPVFMNSTVSDYWENEEEAGVVVNGEKISADCVFCAEGINSRGSVIITGQQNETKETGLAATRGYLDATVTAQDDKLNWIFDDTETGDCLYAWIGPQVNIGITTKKKTKELLCYCCHKVAENGSEVFDHLMKCIDGWTERDKLEVIFRKVTETRFVSQKLLALKTPLKSWLSPGRRMIVIGDAAHATVPTSGQGGTQAIEDAAVLAIALELAGKQDVPLALSVAEKIRYQRAQVIQQGGLAVLQYIMNDIDFESLRKDPTMMRPPNPSWILKHDCQKYAYQEFNTVAEAIRQGTEYVPHNIPADDFRPESSFGGT
ncbi:hypothetical protein FQN49_003198 [Arthroderma sp. PD_2]|nr:hypothetical protein FQN49_003198 [Arthroderma sp. PD_2]